MDEDCDTDAEVSNPGNDDSVALRNQIKLRLLLAGVPASDVDDLFSENSSPDAPDAVDLMRASLLWSDENPITIAEIAQRSGLDVKTCRRARMLLGLPDPGDEAVCRVEEVAVFEGFATAAKLFGEEPVLHFTRVVGSALAAVAEGSMSVFGRALMSRLDDDGEHLQGDAYTLAALEALGSFQIIPTVLEVASKLQFDSAAERLTGGPSEPRHGAIGFVDLIDSTLATEQLDGEVMAAALTRFEEWSVELAVREGGRVIKYIGDEVMFFAPDLPAGCRLAVALMERVDGDEVLRGARAGVAYGELTSRDGDWFGTTVNIAARLVDKARKGSVLIHGEGAAGCDGAANKGRKRLRDIQEKVEVWRIG